MRHRSFVLQNCSEKCSEKCRWATAAFLLFAFCVATPDANAQEPTSKERTAVRKLVREIDRASLDFKSGRFEDAAGHIEQAREMLTTLADSASPAMIELLTPEHQRLSRARTLLVDQGIQVAEIDPLPEGVDPDAPVVSFENDIAPLIVARCGSCHIDRNRGQFSAATWNSLMDSGHVDPGMPSKSRLIEVIEDGDMPPNGELSDEQIDSLKLWIAQGANSPADANANLKTLGEAAENAEPAEALSVKMPTGNETVSFARDVAPVLIENCSGCHVDPANNASGGLNLSRFRDFLEPRESGTLFMPGMGGESLLVKKLRGTGGGARMPQGREPLDDDVIAMIETWINEGAAFDGAAAVIPIRRLAELARVERLTHNELAAERMETASDTWRIVMPDVESNSTATMDLFVIGTPNADRLNAVAEAVQPHVAGIRKELKLESETPLVKGCTTVYVFEKRYDLSEYGAMIDQRELPRTDRSRWNYDVIDSRIAVLLTRNEEPSVLEALLVRDLTAIVVSSQADDVPRWFADGMGMFVAARLLKKSETVEQWTAEAETLVEQLESPAAFINGEMDEDQAALVAWQFIQSLRKADAGRFSRLTAQLRQGVDFQTAFTETWGASPEELVTGERQRRNRRR